MPAPLVKPTPPAGLKPTADEQQTMFTSVVPDSRWGAWARCEILRCHRALPHDACKALFSQPSGFVNSPFLLSQCLELTPLPSITPSLSRSAKALSKYSDMGTRSSAY